MPRTARPKDSEERCEAEMKRNKQTFDEEWEELTRRFQVRKKNGMKEVSKKFNDARAIVDGKTTEANEKADELELSREQRSCVLNSNLLPTN